MPSTTEIKSTITLKTYVDLLQRASKDNLGYMNDLQNSDLRAAKELLNSGLVSDSRIQPFQTAIISKLILTPEGASALVEWSEYLRKENKWQKIGDAFIRAMWLIIGALAATISDILKLIFT